MKTLIALFLIAALSSGCVYVHDKRPGSETTYFSPAFGSKGIKEANFGTGVVKGVTSDQSTMAEAMAGVYAAGVLAGSKGLKP